MIRRIDITYTDDTGAVVSEKYEGVSRTSLSKKSDMDMGSINVSLDFTAWLVVDTTPQEQQ